MAIYKSDGVDAVNVFPSKFITVYSTTAVAKGDVVMIDFSATRSTDQTVDAVGLSVKKATATANTPFACGVATQTITAAGYVQIQYAGYNNTCTCELAGGITLGQFVGTDNTAAGRVQAFSGTNRSDSADYFAVCVDAFTADTADGAIIIFDKGYFNG
jgi:hypothetical protein